MIILTKYSDKKTEEIETITFDHYMTLFHQTNETKEDIIYPIVRSLQDQIELNEKRFMSVYLELDKNYRKSLKETFIETTLDTIVFNALTKTGHNHSQLAKIVKTSIDVGLATRHITWFEDAQDTLQRAHTHWRWSPERFDELKPFFKVITLSYEHGFAKPHPSIFHTTLAKLKVNPEHCLHVGDDPYADIVGAKGARMKTAYIKRSERSSEADIEIYKLSEILRYVK